jgi:large subunit ribosomal protein L7A
MYEGLKEGKKVIGAKQVIRAVEKGLAVRVYVAQNADKRITEPLVLLCQDKNVAVEYAPSMSELGKSCAIEVGAAAVAVLKES